MVREGRFREDLFYRLNVISIDLPPLRQRREDIPLLVNHFLQKYSEENERPMRHITIEALRMLVAYSWPGNVRELENTIERAVVLSSDTEVGPELLPNHIVGRGTTIPSLEASQGATLFSIVEECERRIIVEMLQKCGWNQTEAAERFHVPLSTLNQKIKRLAIEIKKKERGAAGDRVIG
jgi:DNA-binding NtrC family response regulator